MAKFIRLSWTGRYLNLDQIVSVENVGYSGTGVLVSLTVNFSNGVTEQFCDEAAAAIFQYIQDDCEKVERNYAWLP